MKLKLSTLAEATFLVTRVSKEKFAFTNEREDGTEFTVQKWAMSLMPTLNSGFSSNLLWTIYTTSDEVAEVARKLCDTPELVVKNEDGSVTVAREPRLAILNPDRDFAQGDARVNEWVDKKTGESRKGRDKVTVWFTEGNEPAFSVVGMPHSRDVGNIAEITAILGSAAQEAPTVEIVSTSDKPF